MTAVDGTWTRAQLETFLDEALVPVRVGCRHPAGGLWAVALWYRYHDGVLQCATGADSGLAAFLRRDRAVSFDVSTNTPPYMGVRGNGEARIEPDEDRALLRALFERYLGGTDSELGELLLGGDREELAVTIEPDRLYTWDFTEQMGGAVDGSPAVTRGEPPSPKYRDPR